MRTMKKVLTSVCAFALALTVMVMPVSAAEFTDVSNHWSKDFATRWGSAQIFSGYEDGSFGPEREVTRAEMAQVVYNLLGFASEDGRDYEKEFTDVTARDWYRKAVLTCADEGIISGYDDGTFRPGMSITREQAFTLIIKGLGIDADQYLENADDYIEKFADADDISGWAKKFIAALVAYNGIAGSYVGTDLCVLPQKTITRGELAAVLDNLIAVYVDKNGEVSVPVSAADTGEAAEDYKGTFVIVNKEVEDTVEVSFTKDEAENKTVIEVKVGSEQAKTVAVSNEVLEDSGKNEEVKAPTLVQGTTSVPMQEEQKVVVEKVEEESGSEQPTEQKHVHMAGKPENCAVTGLYSDVCYTDVNCADVVEKTWQADVHNFVDGKCKVCGMKETADAMKFHANITSNGEYVDVNVTNDYAAKMVITPGKVDASKATVTVEMQDVASLGVNNLRSETKTFNTGLTGDPALNVWLSEAFDFGEGQVNAVIEDKETKAVKETSYELVGSTDAKGNAVIAATPASVEATREAWAEITKHVASETQTEEDSYIVIANGSYMVVYDDMLCFEKGNVGDLKLDAFSTEGGLAALEDEIRSKVQLNSSEKFAMDGHEFQFYLAAGTKIAVSNSIATLTDDCFITVNSDALENGKDLKELGEILPELQAAENGYAMAEKLVKLLNKMIGAADSKYSVDVHMTFSEPEAVKECDHSQEHRTNCAVAETAYCECGAAQFDLIAIPHTFKNEVCNVCGMTEDEAMKFEARISSNGNYVETVVTNDYAAQVTVTPGNVDASKVDLYVAMQDVASLDVTGKREENKTVSTGLSGNPALNVWLSNAFVFTSGKIEATVEGLPTGYELKGASVDGNAVITATPVNVEHTREAWEELTKFVTTESQSSSDSYVEIANGSFMIVGDDMLSFEDDVEGNLKLDGFTANNGMDSVENEIRSKVKLTTDASLVSDDYEAKFYLAKGTKLAISNSIATIDENCVITLCGDGLKGEDFANILPELQNAESGYAMAEKLVKMINAMIGSADGHTVGIDITFVEQSLKAPVVKKVEAIDVTPVYSANTVVVEEVVEETTEEPVVEEVVEETTEEPVVEEVVEEETTEEPVVEEVVEEEITEEPVVEEVVEEETTEEPVVEEVVEEAAEEPAAE